MFHLTGVVSDVVMSMICVCVFLNSISPIDLMFFCRIYAPSIYKASSYFLAPIAGYDHLIGQYIKYLTKKCLSDEDKYYVNRFERITDGDYEEEEVDERIDGEYGDTEVDDSQREMTRQFFLELEADGKMQMKDNESKMIIQISNESAEYGEEEKYAQHYSKRITDNKMTTLEIS